MDEPALKAVFNIELARDPQLGHVTASNMPHKSEGLVLSELPPGYVLDIFEPTEIMSTYLVAFLVSDFGYTQNTLPSNGVAFNVWVAQGNAAASFNALVGQVNHGDREKQAATSSCEVRIPRSMASRASRAPSRYDAAGSKLLIRGYPGRPAIRTGIPVTTARFRGSYTAVPSPAE